jgi:Tat protein translocase TatB subunit
MLSVPHLIIIFLVALVVLGPEKLPEVARVLGKIMADFRKVSNDFRNTLEDEMREIDRHIREKERLAKEAAAAAAAPPPVPALPESANATLQAESTSPVTPEIVSAETTSVETSTAEATNSEFTATETAPPAAPPVLPDPDARHIVPAASPALIVDPPEHTDTAPTETPSDRAMTEK